MSYQSPLEHPLVIEAIARAYACGRHDQHLRESLHVPGHLPLSDVFAIRARDARAHSADHAPLFDSMAGIELPTPSTPGLSEAA
jgi:hypothetical protein